MQNFESFQAPQFTSRAGIVLIRRRFAANPQSAAALFPVHTSGCGARRLVNDGVQLLIGPPYVITNRTQVQNLYDAWLSKENV